MMTGVVVEGVVAAGKTTLLRHLQQHLVDLRPACTKLVLSEHYAERVLEDRRAACTLTPDEVLTHAAGVLQLIESLHALRAGSKFAGSTAAHFLDKVLGHHRHLPGRMEADRPLLGSRKYIERCSTT